MTTATTAPQPPELVDRDAFEVTARRNLEHAVSRLELEADKHRDRYDLHDRPGDYLLAIQNRNAAATIRELLRPGFGAYGAT